MSETMRNVTVTIAIETNKRTLTETLDHSDYETAAEFAEAVAARIIELQEET